MPRRRVVRLFLLLTVLAFAVLMATHHRAVSSDLRYTRVAEGNISRGVHTIWTHGARGYGALLSSEGEAWGRVRPLHCLYHGVPFLLSMARNGDLFRRDPDVRLPDRLNGDLQTHTLFQLVSFALTLAALGSVMWIVSGAWWPGIVLVLTAVPGNRYLSQNLIVYFCDSGEIGQLLLLSLYLLSVAPMFVGEAPRRKRELAATGFLLLAYAMKETTVVILPMVLAFLSWQVFALRNPSTKFRQFAMRHAAFHVVFAGVLLGAVYRFKSGAYVVQNYDVSAGLGSKLQRSWIFMTLYSDLVPFLIVGGALLAAMGVQMWRRPAPLPFSVGNVVGLFLFSLYLCAAFWLINVPWGQPLEKYYLPAMVFGCMAGVLLVQLSGRLLWTQGFRAASLMWILGSLCFLFRHSPTRVAASRGYYRTAYGHRSAIPRVVEDLVTAARTGAVHHAHIVLDTSMFQEGPLPFQRWLNRFHRMNVSVDRHVVAHAPEVECNYFRRYPGRPALEVTVSGAVPQELDFDSVYFLVPPKPDQIQRLTSLGFVPLDKWLAGETRTPIYKYARQ